MAALCGERAPVTEKPFEARLANLIRMLGSEHEGEVIAAHGALKRLLASRGIGFTDLGDGIEKLATGGLEESEMKRLFKAGYEKGLTDSTRKQAEEQIVYGQRLDGSHDWEAIALYCQHEKARLDAKHHQFIDDMAGRAAWGREPSPRQGAYLISLFRQLGGRVKK
jgi:hypothetical protein